MTTQLSAIYAISENGAIGKDNDIPWKISNDLKRFKKLTTGKSILMGRKTWDSLGRPLPNRRNIVITRNRDFAAEGVEVAYSLEEAIELCKGEPEVFLIGGATLYSEGFEKNLVSVIYQTTVHAEIEGDTFLKVPEPGEGWELMEVESNQADEKNEYAYTYLTLKRVVET